MRWKDRDQDVTVPFWHKADTDRYSIEETCVFQNFDVLQRSRTELCPFRFPELFIGHALSFDSRRIFGCAYHASHDSEASIGSLVMTVGQFHVALPSS